ncbi:SDR family NAD(P)-dependent oxidoreductase, partial [Hypericibacter sp.]|uniref:SDR family NAD(P)-dependent oxidoreductase n=1 Tax=Hypericibacter sp. TaxID=2705401 RepID=UPI003D6D71AD
MPVAIVTAAGQGIGAALARGLAERGYSLALMSRTDAAEKLAEELGGVGMRGSVTEPHDLAKLVDLTLGKYGRIDGVVNNTGRDPESHHVSGPPYDPDLDRS